MHTDRVISLLFSGLLIACAGVADSGTLTGLGPPASPAVDAGAADDDASLVDIGNVSVGHDLAVGGDAPQLDAVASDAGAVDSASPSEAGAPPSPPTGTIVDPLQGTTVGNVIGDVEFVTGGGVRSKGGRIVYDAGRVLTEGYFSCKMRGFKTPAPGTDKSHPLSGWESALASYTHYSEKGSFWNFRIGSNYDAYKVLAAGQGIGTRHEARVGSKIASASETHQYRIEWQNGNVRFLVDGQLLKELAFSRFAIRYVLVGKDDQYKLTAPAPVISDVELGEP